MSRRTVLLSIVLVAAVVQIGVAQETSTRQVAYVDDSGMWIDSVILDGAGEPPQTSMPLPGIIWHLADPISVVNSVALADTTDESWVAHQLNSERMSYLQTTGTGVPIYEFDLLAEDLSFVSVASAEDASLGLLLAQGPAGVSIRAFDATSGATPIWTYAFDANYNFAGSRNVDTSLDGSVVLAAANDSGAGTGVVVVLNSSTGAELSRKTYPVYIGGIELSDDGSRATLSKSADAEVIETAGLTTLHAFSCSGGGNVYQRLSGDGTVAACAGFDYKAYRESGGVWTQVWHQSEASQWFGRGIALSGDGDTLLACSYTYTNYLDLTYRVIDLAAGVEVARTTTSGSGSLQDTIVQVQSSADGQVFAVASWGTQDNAHPEGQIFNRSLSLIGGIDMPGSAFSIDLTRNGQYVLVGGKAVHANIAGNGSDTYAFELGPPPEGIPTVSTWGLVMTALVGFAVATVVLRRARVEQT